MGIYGQLRQQVCRRQDCRVRRQHPAPDSDGGTVHFPALHSGPGRVKGVQPRRATFLSSKPKAYTACPRSASNKTFLCFRCHSGHLDLEIRLAARSGIGGREDAGAQLLSQQCCRRHTKRNWFSNRPVSYLPQTFTCGRAVPQHSP